MVNLVCWNSYLLILIFILTLFDSLKIFILFQFNSFYKLWMGKMGQGVIFMLYLLYILACILFSFSLCPEEMMALISWFPCISHYGFANIIIMQRYGSQFLIHQIENEKGISTQDNLFLNQICTESISSYTFIYLLLFGRLQTVAYRHVWRCIRKISLG